MNVFEKEIQAILNAAAKAAKKCDQEEVAKAAKSLLAYRELLQETLAGEGETEEEIAAENALLYYRAEFLAAEEILEAIENGYQIVEWRTWLDRKTNEILDDVRRTLSEKWYANFIAVDVDRLERELDIASSPASIVFDGWIFIKD